MMKLKDITPKALLCGVAACPSIYEREDGSFVIIGKRLKDATIERELHQKIGPDEIAIEVPRELLANARG